MSYHPQSKEEITFWATVETHSQTARLQWDVEYIIDPHIVWHWLLLLLNTSLFTKQPKFVLTSPPVKLCSTFIKALHGLLCNCASIYTEIKCALLLCVDGNAGHDFNFYWQDLPSCQTHIKQAGTGRLTETQRAHTHTHTAWGCREAWQPPQCWSETQSCSREWLPLLHHLCTGLSSMQSSDWGCTQGELCCYFTWFSTLRILCCNESYFIQRTSPAKRFVFSERMMMLVLKVNAVRQNRRNCTTKTINWQFNC